MSDVFDNDATQQSAEKMATQTWNFNKEILFEVLQGLGEIPKEVESWDDDAADELRVKVKGIILANKKKYLSKKQKEKAAGDPF